MVISQDNPYPFLGFPELGPFPWDSLSMSSQVQNNYKDSSFLDEFKIEDIKLFGEKKIEEHTNNSRFVQNKSEYQQNLFLKSDVHHGPISYNPDIHLRPNEQNTAHLYKVSLENWENMALNSGSTKSINEVVGDKPVTNIPASTLKVKK